MCESMDLVQLRNSKLKSCVEYFYLINSKLIAALEKKSRGNEKPHIFMT